MPMDYASLQADAVAWAVRPELAALAPSFIALAEAGIGRKIRMLEQETDATLTASAPDYTAALPAGFLGFKHVFVTNATNPRTTYCPPTKFHELNNLPNDAFNAIRGDAATIYTIESNKLKVFKNSPSGDPIMFDVSYIKRFDALSVTNTSNVLLQNHYDLYLWGTLVQLWDYLDDTEQVAKYQARFDRVAGEIEDQEVRKRMPSGPLVARPPEIVV